MKAINRCSCMIMNIFYYSFKNAILSIAASCFNNIIFSSSGEFLSSIDKETLDDDVS